LMAALGLGLLADSIGAGQRINLLAPPVWTLVAWNLAVYLWLIGAAVAALLGRRRAPGPLRRWVRRLLGKRGEAASGAAAPADAGRAALLAFGTAWARLGAPLAGHRSAALLHSGAAALGLGVMLAMYLRGLVLDYRADWQSTFLQADTVHAVLSTLLAPALALTGIGLPDAATLEQLRAIPGQDVPGAPAAPWIHLYAVTLLLFVVGPRALLALAAGWRARAIAQRFPLPLNEPYFQRLLRQQRGGTTEVLVLPYAHTPPPQSTLGLHAVLARLYGDGLQIHVLPTVAFGDEEAAPAPPAAAAAPHALFALFDLASTPEPESHGRFMQTLAARGGATMLVDEAAFRRRFGAESERVQQRRQAWRQWAASFGATPVFVDLHAPDLAAAEQALQAASSALHPA
jgi:Protein of unknown function (DUF2868)